MFTALSRLSSAVFLLVFFSFGTLAQSGIVDISSSQGTGRKIELTVGKSITVNLPSEANEVFAAKPEIATAVVQGPKSILLVGMGVGVTTVSVFGSNGQQMFTLEVETSFDLDGLRRALSQSSGGTNVRVSLAGLGVLVTGSVRSSADATRVLELINGFLGQDLNGNLPIKVINNLKVNGRDQVMLKVAISEIQSSVLKQLGVDVSGSWNLGSIALDAASKGTSFPVNGMDLSVGAVSLSGSSGNGITIRAMQEAGMARVLAEPTLVAISGEAASFLVGGEIPIPVGSSCSGNNSNDCTLTVSYKPIGVSLNFTPVVLDEGRISLRVSTEVSEIDNASSVKLTAVSIPGIKTRRTETTVELASGGTLVTAGLLQQSSRQSISSVPGIANLPIIGALFRSRDYQRRETELVISVTPFIVTPGNTGNVVKPTSGFEDASDPDTILLQEINRIYKNGRSPSYTGPIGFIDD